jgi:hypothetical protein
MKTIQVNNFKNFLRKAAVRYNTTIQQVVDVADELGCTILCQQRKMYSKDYTYMLISQEDVYKILNELEARKDNLAQRTEARKRKRTCKEDKLEWLIDQGAQVDATDKPNIYTVSMYNGAIVKHFNINCSMTNIQDYFDRCFCKHKDEDYDKQGKLVPKSVRQVKSEQQDVPVIETGTTAPIDVTIDEVVDEKGDPAELREMFRTLEV